MFVVVCCTNQGIFISYDSGVELYGVDPIIIKPNLNLLSISCDSTGKYLVTSSYNYYIYFFDDCGLSRTIK